MLQFSVLNRDCNISHFVTTRHGGYSKAHYASFNISPYCGDDPIAVNKNKAILSKELSLDSDRFFLPGQTHGDGIKIINNYFLSLSNKAQTKFLENTDALITSVPGICIGVATADCVPILVYDTKQKIIAAIHAGWRGTVKRVTEKTVALMIKELSSNPKDLLAGIGPSIGPEAFEVGEEVVEEFKLHDLNWKDLTFINHTTGKSHIDLWKANKLQLLECGIPEQQIEICEICTYTNHTDLFSARRLGIKSGRIISGIYIKE